MSARPTVFGQAVIGTPGSGKSTYCNAMADFLRAEKRQVAIVNFDPGNDALPFTASIDVAKLITVEDVMEKLGLGPNGALIYCMEFIEKNMDWFFAEVAKFPDHYFIFDMPGQIELYCHHNSVRNIFQLLQGFGFRLCCVQLIDSHHCSDPGKFISVLLTALTAMCQSELPQINILSKIDIAEQQGKLLFGLDFYTEVLDLKYLLGAMDEDPFTKKYRKLNACLVEVIENFSLVTFLPLSVSNSKLLGRVKSAVDKANGYIFGPEEKRQLLALLSTAHGAEFQGEYSGTVAETFRHYDDSDESDSMWTD